MVSTVGYIKTPLFCSFFLFVCFFFFFVFFWFVFVFVFLFVFVVIKLLPCRKGWGRE